jgi:hypothetical protein
LDIATLFAAGLVGPLDALILHKRYRILYLERFLTADGLHLLVKLGFNSTKDFFSIYLHTIVPTSPLHRST